MKKLFHLIFLHTSFLLFCAAAEESTRPNIILIISDDHAYNDYGFMGNSTVQTPHLDRMASESLVYQRGYVMPVCSPTLASLLTGKMPHAHGITGNDLAKDASKNGQREKLLTQLKSTSPLLPQAMSDAGYLTFQTGKLWNATFQEVGFTHGMTHTSSRHGDSGLKIGRESMQPIYDFIEMSQKKEKPFFIWHAPFLPHIPHNPPERLLEKYRGKGPTPAAEKYYAMVEWLDETTGELDQFLQKEGLKENTIVIYLADNGWDSQLALKGNRAKLSPYEAGIRTPIFIRWPGKITPHTEAKTLAHVTDIAPTILDLAGVEKPKHLHGQLLHKPEQMAQRKTVWIESYTHDITDLSAPEKSLIARVVINGWWKIIIPGPQKPDRKFSGVPEKTSLFNLKNDPKEQTDLADKFPDQVERLVKLQAESWEF